MFNLGDWLISIFGTNGGISLIIILFLVFFIDALIFPTLPEVFFVGALTYRPDFTWAVVLLITAAIAEMVGVFTLFQLTEHVKVPKRVKSIVEKYVNFLIISDERMVLANRFVPLLPFTGALASMANWNIKLVLFYNAIGCFIKYGLLAIIGGSLMAFFGPDGGIYTIILVVVVLVISGVYTYYKRKNRNAEVDNNEDS